MIPRTAVTAGGEQEGLLRRLQAEACRLDANVAAAEGRLEVLHYAYGEWEAMLGMMAGTCPRVVGCFFLLCSNRCSVQETNV